MMALATLLAAEAEAVGEAGDLGAEGAHHPNGGFYGDLNEVIWSSLAFLIIVGALYKFAWPSIKKALNDRTDKIERELGEAEAAKAEAQSTTSRLTSSLSDPEQDAAKVVVDARKTAEALKVQLRQRTDAEVRDLRTRAEADITAGRGQAIADLQAEVSGLTLGAAESVVRRNLDASTLDGLIEDYITQVGASN